MSMPRFKTVFTMAVLALLAGCANTGGPGLFSLRAPANDIAPLEEIDVPYEAAVSFGEIARVCEARDKPLGVLVATTETGNFEVHDTAPGGITLRRFFLTGFADGCPRQFMASTTAFGTPSAYEALHYGKDSFVQGATDLTYDQIKAEVCGVPAGAPCGKRIGKLDRTTVFLSAYDLTGATEHWTDYLLHNGTLVASAVKRTDKSISE